MKPIDDFHSVTTVAKLMPAQVAVGSCERTWPTPHLDCTPTPTPKFSEQFSIYDLAESCHQSEHVWRKQTIQFRYFAITITSYSNIVLRFASLAAGY